MDENQPLKPLPPLNGENNGIITDTIDNQPRLRSVPNNLEDISRHYEQIDQLRRMTRENILKAKIRKMEIIRFGEDLPDITNVKKKAKKVKFFYKALTL